MGEKFEIVNRAKLFSSNVIRLYSLNIKVLDGREIILKQLLRSATSIGANLVEADDADSLRDTIRRIAISRREAKETIYWLSLLKDFKNINSDKINEAYNEAIEINLILSSIIKKLKAKLT